MTCVGHGWRRWTAASLAVVGSAAVPLALRLVEWSRSGEVGRNGYELARSLDRLGDVDTPGRRALFVAVHLLPALAALVVVALALGRVRPAGVLAGMSGVIGLITAVVGERAGAPDDAWLATLCAGGAALAGGGALLAVAPRRPQEREAPAEALTTDQGTARR